MLYSFASNQILQCLFLGLGVVYFAHVDDKWKVPTIKCNYWERKRVFLREKVILNGFTKQGESASEVWATLSGK